MGADIAQFVHQRALCSVTVCKKCEETIRISCKCEWLQMLDTDLSSVEQSAINK